MNSSLSDSRFYRFLSRTSDLVILNLCFLVSCLPIFTVGAALTAMYDVCFRMGTQKEEKVFPCYLRAFRNNFKQSTLLWLLWLSLGLVSAYLVFMLLPMEPPVRYLSVVFAVQCVVLIAAGGYLFPLISQFENTGYAMIRNSLLLSLARLPKTIAIALLNILPWALAFFNLNVLLFTGYIWLLIYFSLAAYFNTMVLRKVFEPLYESAQSLSLPEKP